MGLQSRSQSSGNTNYLSISKGHFIQSATATTEGAIPRVNKNGITVYELHFDNDFYGTISDVRIMPNGYDGKDEIKMSFVDSDHIRWVVQFGLRSSYGRRFMSTFWNINTKEEIAISPYYFTPKGSSDIVNGMNILQFGEKVPPFYTNDEPGQVPPLATVVVKGENVIDDTTRVDYLKQLFNHWRELNFPEQVAREAEYVASQNQQYSRPAQVAPTAVQAPQTVRVPMPPAPPAPPINRPAQVAPPAPPSFASSKATTLAKDMEDTGDDLPF